MSKTDVKKEGYIDSYVVWIFILFGIMSSIVLIQTRELRLIPIIIICIIGVLLSRKKRSSK